jgi:segregation and condensation protein B
LNTLAAAIEAILFSSSRAFKVRELQQVTDSDRAGVEQALEELRESLIHGGLMLQRHHDQVQLVTRPELAGYVRRALRPEVTGRLSAAAYETLAIVAYQQPVTRSKIEEIRGVNSDGVLANLELRDLVREVGRGAGPGQPRLFGTTIRFLQMLGLESLEELPFPDTQELPEQPAAPAEQPAGEPVAGQAEAGAAPAAESGEAATGAGEAATGAEEAPAAAGEGQPSQSA